MPSQASDIAIIGAGSAGMAAARRAVQAGLSVTLFEGRNFGGTCVNAGCVPKKLLVHASRMRDALRESPHLGWFAGPVDFDWPTLRDCVTQEVQRLSALHRDRLRDIGVRVIAQHAMLNGSAEVRVTDGSVLRAQNILLATGARPRVPDFPGRQHCLTSDDIFHLPELPTRIAIIGGGYIAVEFACLLSRFGVEVAIFEASDGIVQGFDPDVATRLEDSMRAQGIDVKLQSTVLGVEKTGEIFKLKLGRDYVASVDQVLVATGRAPNTDGLGLLESGVRISASGAIATDDRGTTSVPGVYAAGDVAERMMLTPVAVQGARSVIDTIVGVDQERENSAPVPTATFTTPECAGVGMTYEDAARAGFDVDVRTKSFTPLTAGPSGSDDEVFLKAIVARDTGLLLGMHFFGPRAAEAAQLAAVALSAGLTERQLRNTMSLHPSIAEEVIGLGDPDMPLHLAASGPRLNAAQ